MYTSRYKWKRHETLNRLWAKNQKDTAIFFLAQTKMSWRSLLTSQYSR